MHQGRISVGHPVDVASGTVYSSHEDISIPGKVALTWERGYTTALLNMPPTPLGPGWIARYFATLTYADTEFQFFAPEGGVEVFSDPEEAVERGGTVRNLGTFQELIKLGNRYIITRWDIDTGEIERYVFAEGKKGEAWPVASIENVTGQGLDMLRDPSGRLIGIRQRLEQRTLVIRYNSRDLITAISYLLPDNRQQVLISYEYDRNDKLNAAYDALGYADRYEYDASSRITREIIKDGGVFYFKYDGKGRCIKTSGLDRYDERSFRYLDSIHWTEVTDSRGRVIRFQWLPSGQVTSEIDLLGGIEQTEYDEYGRIVAKTSPDGARKKYEYDEWGNRCKITDPLGHETVIAYAEDHLARTLTTPDGSVWRRQYDASNRLVATEDPLGARWTFIYDRAGNLIQVTDPNGAYSRQEFSQTGVLLEATDWEGNLARYTVDYFGRIVERIGPLGEVTRFKYDLLGNPLAIEFADGSRVTYEYDSGSNLISMTESNGSTRRYRYGPCGRLLERKDPLGHTIKYIWGSTPDELKEIINEKGEVYNFLYDDAGRIVHEKGFDGRQLEFIYDQAGYCSAIVNGLGDVVSYTHDLMGRVVEECLPDGTINTFKYDVLGNLIYAASPDCEVRYERDRLGRVVKEYQGNYIIETQYDRAGNFTLTRTSLGYEVAYAFDGNGLLSRLTTKAHGALEFKRNGRGEEITRLLPGGMRLDQRYDALGQLVEQGLSLSRREPPLPSRMSRDTAAITPSGNTIVRRVYRYDRSRSLTSIKDGYWGEIAYVYDAADHLIQAIREKGRAEHFAYDSTGNLTRIGDGGAGEQVLEYNQGNRLVRQGETTYVYDANGRLIKKIEASESSNPRKWHYTWNALDQLKCIKTPEGEVWEYVYDALGRRISKRGPKRCTQFIWYQDVIVHQIENDALDSSWIFDPHTFKPLCKLQRGTLYFVIHDHLGTPRELVETRGGIAWSASFKSWGEIEEEQKGKIGCPIRFPGQWFDEESGLHYSRFRYYDPHNGRFLTPDPIGLLGGLNHYVYAPNPINWIDPLGLAPLCDKDKERAKKAAEKTIEEAKDGKVRRTGDYHGRLGASREQEIIANPDAVFVSTGKSKRLIFAQGGDVVITEGAGSQRGQVVTSYGPSGPQGASGAAIFGGSPSDPGQPVTPAMITGGTVPTPGGGTEAPGVQILP